MTIEIHRPKLEALIMRRMKGGGFHNVEDALLQALKTSEPVAEASLEKRTGADLIAALQASPYRELDIEPPKVRLTAVRDVKLRSGTRSGAQPMGATADLWRRTLISIIEQAGLSVGGAETAGSRLWQVPTAVFVEQRLEERRRPQRRREGNTPVQPGSPKCGQKPHREHSTRSERQKRLGYLPRCFALSTGT